MSIKKICWHSRGSNQFLLNGKMRLLDSGPGTSVSTSTPACFLAGAVISQLVGQILLKRSPSSRDLPRICRKPGLDPWTCQLLKTRWIFYYKSERWSNETNPQWVKSGGQRKKRCRCYHCVCVHMLSYFQLFCNPMDCSRPGSSVHGISQARILEWGAISSSRGSSWSRELNPCLFCHLHWQANSLPLETPGKS